MYIKSLKIRWKLHLLVTINIMFTWAKVSEKLEYQIVEGEGVEEGVAISVLSEKPPSGSTQHRGCPSIPTALVCPY